MHTTCPNCGSSNIYIDSRDNGVKGYGCCGGLLGLICLGPIGLLCGFLGMGSPKGRTVYMKCNNCGWGQSYHNG